MKSFRSSDIERFLDKYIDLSKCCHIPKCFLFASSFQIYQKGDIKKYCNELPIC